jgi:small nuclear ribonucleoprotein (snRNP)-like protein
VLLQALHGTRVTVELKDDTQVAGTLGDADARMNLTLRHVDLTHPRRPPQHLWSLFLAGRAVRMVHLPEDLSLAAALAAADRRAAARARRARAPAARGTLARSSRPDPDAEGTAPEDAGGGAAGSETAPAPALTAAPVTVDALYDEL